MNPVTWIRRVWRGLEARIRRSEEVIPPAIAQFEIGEVIPLKGFNWKVAYVAQMGIVLAPLEFTAARRKVLAAQLREDRRHEARREEDRAIATERYVARA